MKKVSLLMAAFALVLGFSQCSKKPVMPSYSGPAGDMILQDITLSATRGNGGGDSKVSVVDNSLQWDKEDVITVLDEDKTELGELYFVKYGEKDGVEDKTSAVFESRGSIPCPQEGKLTFTVGSVGKEDNFQNQAGDGKSLYLTGEATCNGTGNYEDVLMEANNYALLKLNLSAFIGGTKDEKIQMTIESGEDVVASVANIADISKSVYVAVPAPVKERFYTITCNENKAVKKWKALKENTFYTKDAAGEAIVIELPKKEIPVAEPKGEPAATGVSLTYNIKDDPLPIEDGVVYSENEDMSEYKTAEYTAPGKGEQEHTVTLTGLTAGTTYYVRVYAKYNGSGSQEIVYGEQTDFTTDIVPTTPKFTVANGKTVEFAPGNLWYGTEDDAKPQEKAFHFEANQWSFASTWDASHVSHFFWSNTTDWQTSGKEPYAASYSYSTQTTDDVFFTNATETTANENFQVSGETKGTWRTLSNDEWAYLLNTSGSSGRNDVNRFAKALVNGVKGLLVFPDKYSGTASGDGIAVVNKVNAGFPTSDIPNSTWTSMETSGVVFLPAAGSRSSTSVINAGSGYYWSSTPRENSQSSAYRMQFLLGTVSTGNIQQRSGGYPVRLVRDVK